MLNRYVDPIMPWVPLWIRGPFQALNDSVSWWKPCRRLQGFGKSESCGSAVCLPGRLPEKIDTTIVGHIWAQADWALRFFRGLNLQCGSAVCRLLLTEDWGTVEPCDMMLKVFWKEANPHQICHWNHGSMKRLAGALTTSLVLLQRLGQTFHLPVVSMAKLAKTCVQP